MTSDVDTQMESLMRGCERVYTEAELKSRLASPMKMRVKLGMDPTAPDLTLGHTVVLRKLRQFQDLGHLAVLVIGDYTAKVGDPTGRSKTRPVLSNEEIDRNAETYLDQAGKVLDLSPDKLEVRRNGEWLEPLCLADILNLMGQMTVARMLERDTFAKRQEAGKEIHLHELLYPLMQAYDSVVIRADVELGGSDQTFNNLCGRDLQRNAGQPPQLVMTTPLLVGTDGVNKMSKSMGNYIAINDVPADMFGKVMRVPDELMVNYYELLTDERPEEYGRWVDPAECHPRDAKERLAKIIITQYHSAMCADSAAEEFRRVHGKGGGLPDDVPSIAIESSLLVDGCMEPVQLTIYCKFAKSRSDARRLIAERGLRVNGEVVEDALKPIPVCDGDVVQRGKRRFGRLVLS